MCVRASVCVCVCMFVCVCERERPVRVLAEADVPVLGERQPVFELVCES